VGLIKLKTASNGARVSDDPVLHLVHSSYLASIVAAGRCRWKIENENNNTLKTKGYHLEHNFGHGKYQLIRKKRGSRKGFFEDIRSLTKFFLFESWQALIDFMISGQLPAQIVNSS
jgi:hypothetical protein